MAIKSSIRLLIKKLFWIVKREWGQFQVFLIVKNAQKQKILNLAVMKQKIINSFEGCDF